MSVLSRQFKVRAGRSESYSYGTNKAVRFLDPLGLQPVPPMSPTHPPPPPKGSWNIGSYYVCNRPPGPTIGSRAG